MKPIAPTCLALALLGACHGRPPIEAPAPADKRYRPSWMVVVEDHLPAIRACLISREQPRFVLFVESLSDGTGVSTVDASGVVEHCAWDGEDVVRRELTRMSMEDFRGLPLFSLGPAMPRAQDGSLLEEVLQDDKPIGWMFWPPEPTSAPVSRAEVKR